MQASEAVLEKVHTQFLKCLIGVSIKTPYNIVIAELAVTVTVTHCNFNRGNKYCAIGTEFMDLMTVGSSMTRLLRTPCTRQFGLVHTVLLSVCRYH